MRSLILIAVLLQILLVRCDIEVSCACSRRAELFSVTTSMRGSWPTVDGDLKRSSHKQFQQEMNVRSQQVQCTAFRQVATNGRRPTTCQNWIGRHPYLIHWTQMCGSSPHRFEFKVIWQLKSKEDLVRCCFYRFFCDSNQGTNGLQLSWSPALWPQDQSE